MVGRAAEEVHKCLVAEVKDGYLGLPPPVTHRPSNSVSRRSNQDSKLPEDLDSYYEKEILHRHVLLNSLNRMLSVLLDTLSTT